MKNQIFGVYKVLYLDEQATQEKKKKYWMCECQKCKSIQSVRQDGLKREPKGCPKCRYNNNLLNQKFGKLQVMEKGHTDKNGHVYWVCKCECGNIKEISASNLKNNKTLSCGCLQKEIISALNFQDLTGQKFGKLTVLKRVSELGERVCWLCQCECGNTTEVQSNNLKNGHTTSCGCIHSKGEHLIRQLLLELNYEYKTEFIFNDLPNRRFDFYLPKENICIEFDGKQHFHFIGTWHESEEEFQKSIQRDKEKTEFCLKNNISLIRIPYYDYEKLNKEYLEKIIKEKCNNDKSSIIPCNRRYTELSK